MAAYSFNIDLAQAGQIADASLRRIDSYPNHGADLDFGVAVHINVNDAVFKSGSADPVIGITVFSHTHEEGLYPAYTAVSVLTKGRVYVKVSVNVTYNQLAYIDASGNFTNVATDNKLVGIFLTSALLDNLAVLEFDFDTINIQ